MPVCVPDSVALLKPQEVRDIFDRNMLDDWDMKETLDQLIGIEEEKPL